MDIGRLIASLSLENQEFLRGVQEAERRMKTSASEMQRAATAVGDRWQEQGRRMQKVGKSMSLYLTTPLTLIGGLMTSTAMKFEAGMSQVAAVSGATGQELQSLEDIAREMGATTKFSAVEAAGALNFLAMAGFSVQDSLAALPATLNLAAAGAMELATAADIVSNVMQGFGIDAERTAYVSDVLTEAFTNANTSLHQLGDAMSYAAPVSRAFGVSIEETTAAIGFLSDAGIQAGRAGTSLRQMLLQLSDKAGELGLNIRDANGRLLGLADMLEVVEESGLSADEMIAALGARAGPGFAVLLDRGSDALREFTGQLEESEGAAQRVAEIQIQNLSGALTILRSALSELSISWMSEFLPALRAGAERLKDVVDWLAQLNAGTRRTIVVLGTILAAIGPLLIVVGQFVRLLGGAVKVLALKRGAMVAWVGVTRAATAVQLAFNRAMAANPIGVTVTLLAGAVAALHAWNRVKRESTELERAHSEIRARANKETEDEIANIEYLRRVIENANVPLERRKEAVEELNKIVPAYNAQLSQEGLLLNANTLALRDYLTELRNRATLVAMQDVLQEQLREIQREKLRLISLETEYALALEQGLSKGSAVAERHQRNIRRSQMRIVSLEQSVDQLSDSYGEFQTQLERESREIQIRNAIRLVTGDLATFTETAKKMDQEALTPLREQLEVRLAEATQNASLALAGLRSEQARLGHGTEVSSEALIGFQEQLSTSEAEARALKQGLVLLNDIIEEGKKATDDDDETKKRSTNTLNAMREAVAKYQQDLEHAEIGSAEFITIQNKLIQAQERLQGALDQVGASMEGQTEELSSMEAIAEAARITMEGLEHSLRAIDLRARVVLDYDDIDATEDKLREARRELAKLLELPDMDLVLKAGFEIDELIAMPDAELEALGIDIETRGAIQAVQELLATITGLETHLEGARLDRTFVQLGENMEELGQKALAMQVLGMEFNLAAEQVSLLEGKLLKLTLAQQQGSEQWEYYRQKLEEARSAMELGETLDLMSRDLDWMNRAAAEFSEDLAEDMSRVTELFEQGLGDLNDLFAEGLGMTDPAVQALIQLLSELGVEFDKLREKAEKAAAVSQQWEFTAKQAASAIGSGLAELTSESDRATQEIVSDMLRQVTAILIRQYMETLPFPTSLIFAATAPAVAEGLFSSIGMREGGVVPEGYTGDKYPAWLNSGEVITPPEKLEVFLSDLTQKIIREVTVEGDQQLPAITQEITPVIREMGGSFPEDMRREVEYLLRPAFQVTSDIQNSTIENMENITSNVRKITEQVNTQVQQMDAQGVGFWPNFQRLEAGVAVDFSNNHVPEMNYAESPGMLYDVFSRSYKNTEIAIVGKLEGEDIRLSNSRSEVRKNLIE